MNVFGQTHRALKHSVSAVGNVTEAGDIISYNLITMAQLSSIETQGELEQKKEEVYAKYPHLIPTVPKKK